jgi:hypothetical protein
MSPIKLDAIVGEGGKVEVDVPFPPGTCVHVLVQKETDDFWELMLASQSSLGFWDNPQDDEAWNDA